MTGRVKRIPSDLTISQQLMRPLFLNQIIFAGFMACTSIFYFLDVLGYEDFKAPNSMFVINQAELLLVAKCQRYYCLGHACLVTGMLAGMNYNQKKEYYINQKDLSNFLLVASFTSLILSGIFQRVGGLSQFYGQFKALSFVASTLTLAYSIPRKRLFNIITSSILYLLNLYESLLSGYKEPVIVSILVLGVFLYPSYKKLVSITFIPLLVMAFVILPRFNTVFRELAWTGEESTEEAYESALEAALNDNNPYEDDSNWGFLSGRLSEISLFTKYVKSTPDEVPYYGMIPIRQSVSAIIPRFLWPGKPVPEELVMERAYRADIVSRNSNVSAKPQFIADAYLSLGTIGVILFLFLYGLIAQRISVRAEHLFGGYLLGSALIYSGLFQLFWRGLSFEFLINNIFWAYISMWMIFRVLRATHVINKY
jgi:uncharacterized membrane protein